MLTFRSEVGHGRKDEWGVGEGRRSGPNVAWLWVQSERTGDVPIATHPLTKLFFRLLETAADQCLEP
jgi:hypothetical protein